MMDKEIRSFESRKRDHIEQSLNPSNQAVGMTGFESVRLRHEALPDLDFQNISLSCESLGQVRRTPFFVSSMTAGHVDGLAINSVLAKACAQSGWPLAVGSQRRQLFDVEAQKEWHQIRAESPKTVMFSNLGIAQIIRSTTDQVQRLVDSLEATAIFIHLNALQECIQPEGTPQFSGGWEAIERLVKTLDVPVLVKETGCGMTLPLMKRLEEIGVAAIDVAGLGGTHWGRIEGHRGDQQIKRVSETFANWGVPTVESLCNASSLKGVSEIWASGGIRTGLDAAKSLALGAKQVGFAKPALENALKGESALLNWFQTIEKEFSVAMFCTGSSSPKELKGKYDIK